MLDHVAMFFYEGIYFGLIYLYGVHAADIIGEMRNKTSPVHMGMSLFSKALNT